MDHEIKFYGIEFKKLYTQSLNIHIEYTNNTHLHALCVHARTHTHKVHT